MGVSDRVYNLLRSLVDDQVESVDRWLNEGKTAVDERITSWENSFEEKQNERSGSGSENWNHKYKDGNGTPNRSVYSDQVVDDLKIFGLSPPSNLSDVKKARNREIKKYHPDIFSSDKGKLETAKEILQIYNEVFNRLKKHYSSKQD